MRCRQNHDHVEGEEFRVDAGAKIVELNDSKGFVEHLYRENETIEIQAEQMRLTVLDAERTPPAPLSYP